MSRLSLPAAVGVALGFLVGIIAHEVVTARVADAAGDKTSRMRGRLAPSLRAHADPLGTFVLPAVFTLAALFRVLLALPVTPFGYGKPHDLNPRALRNPRRDVVLVSLAGPAATLALAVVAAVVAGDGPCNPLTLALDRAALVLVAMTVIELLPVPGRDGGRILARFLSPRAAAKMEDLQEYHAAFVLVLIVLLGTLTWAIVWALAAPLLGPECLV